LFVVRELSTDKRRLQAIFWSVHWLKLLLVGFVVAFGLVFGKWGIADDGRRILFYVLIARVLLQTFSQASMAVFKAFEFMESVSLPQSLNSLVVVVWLGAALALHTRLQLIVAALVAAQLVGTVSACLCLRHR